MTIYDAALKGLTYVAASVGDYVKKNSAEEEEPDTQVTPVDLTKLVESVSGGIFIGMLITHPPKTKIHIASNTIMYDLPGWFQGYNRTGVGSRKDFKIYRIFHRTFIMDQKWYPIGSEGAKAIARLKRFDVLGLEPICETYKEDYIPAEIYIYLKATIQFIRDNELEPLPQTLELMSRLSRMYNPTYSDFPITPPVIDIDVDQDDFTGDKEVKPDGSAGDKDGKQDESAADMNVKQEVVVEGYDPEDDLLSEASDDDKHIVAAALSTNNSDLMKSLYTVKELTTLADRVETLYEHLQSDDKLVKEQVPGERKGIIQSLIPKIKLYQQKMNQDLLDRY